MAWQLGQATISCLQDTKKPSVNKNKTKTKNEEKQVLKKQDITAERRVVY